MDAAPIESPSVSDSSPVDAEFLDQPDGAESEEGEPSTDLAVIDRSGDQRPVIDNKLSAPAKAALDQIRTSNPTLATTLQRALFLQDRILRELPGGMKELQTMRQRIEELGGETGIQEFRGELDGWRAFDQQYTAADPKVLDFLTNTPEAQDAFLKIAPMAFNKFAELNPDGYASYLARAVISDMEKERLPLAMMRLQDFIGENPRAIEVYNQIAQYF